MRLGGAEPFDMAAIVAENAARWTVRSEVRQFASRPYLAWAKRVADLVTARRVRNRRSQGEARRSGTDPRSWVSVQRPPAVRLSRPERLGTRRRMRTAIAGRAHRRSPAVVCRGPRADPAAGAVAESRRTRAMSR